MRVLTDVSPAFNGDAVGRDIEKRACQVVSMVSTDSRVAVLDGRVTHGEERAESSRRMAADEQMCALYKAHGAALYRFLLGMTFGDKHFAEDLLQETLLRAWTHLDQLAPDVSTLRPWLFTVARRIAIDAARARQARPREVGAVDLTVVPERDDAIEQLIAVQTVRNALRQLTPAHRQVIIEVYYRGRSVAEAADLLGIPEGTIKSRTFNALRALRAALGDRAFSGVA